LDELLHFSDGLIGFIQLSFNGFNQAQSLATEKEIKANNAKIEAAEA
jgi:hypothetical protein